MVYSLKITFGRKSTTKTTIKGNIYETALYECTKCRTRARFVEPGIHDYKYCHKCKGNVYHNKVEEIEKL